MSQDGEGSRPLLSVSRTRRDLADLINRVAYGGERIVIGRRGRGVAALVSIKDLELIEKVEDKSDVQAARRAIAEARGKKRISWEEIKRRLGLSL
ncbi:MAG TPA: type II toxin-antitoxin system Phd/YefM family antitoxin [Planctomycetota bacterium]|nr:type II toxin-antitoxin system Phd/YefM family antitoxin [Planctomycetota bacterium]